MKLLYSTNSFKWAEESVKDALNEFGAGAVFWSQHRASDGDFIYEILLNEDALCDAGCVLFPFL